MTLEKKLAELNQSAQSIQQLSLWIIHHRKHYVSIVKTWFRNLGKIPAGKKLTHLYLANDVVQNSKKKHPEFAKEFGGVMKQVIGHMAAIRLEMKTVKAVGRLLGIWQDRTIFDPKVQTEISRIWTTKTLETEAQGDEAEAPAAKKKKVKDESSGKDKEVIQRILASSASPEKKSPSTADPPEPEELIKALQDLENAASSDAVIREKISRLPPEVSEISHLDKIESVEEGRNLLRQVDQATELLTAYNERLQQELKDRKRVDKMIVDFLAAQKDLLAQAEERLELYRDKLDEVNSVKDDIQSHIQSLPDLTQLPDVTGGLPPLPSAGDLFTAR